MAPKNDPGVGSDYEVYFMAYLSLMCLLNDEVEDFEIESNAQHFGKFDDSVVRVTFRGGQKETTCIQLKHKDKSISTAQLEADKGKFSIQSYYDSFKEIQDKDKANLIYILFTNSKINADNINKSEKFEISKSLNFKGFHKMFKSTENVYQISDKLKLNDGQYETFLGNFYFYTGQANEKQLEQSIYKIFKEEFGSNEDFAIKFIQFFKDLHKGRFTDKKIQKRTLHIHLISLLLKPFMLQVDENNAIHKNSAFQHLEKLMLLFDFILLQDINLQTTLIKTPSIIRDDLVRWAKNNKFIECQGNLSPINNYELLFSCFEQKIPFCLNYDETSFESINALARLNQNSNANHFKFILVGSETSFAHFVKNDETLSNLSDIEMKNCDVYENIVNNFGISIEGRKKMVLKTFIQIDDELKVIITVDLLLKALQDDCVIKVGKSKEDEKLPDFYIPRIVYQYGVSLESIREHKNVLFVIHCESYLEFVKQAFGDDCIILDELNNDTSLQSYGNIVLTDNSYNSELMEKNILNKFTKTEKYKTVHHLYLYHEHNSSAPNLDWFRCCEVGNSVNSNDIETFSFEPKSSKKPKITQSTDANLANSLNLPLLSEQEIDNTKLLKKLSVKEEDIFSHFTNDVELICGRPGVGKSTMMSNLRLNCSENYWCVRVNFKDIGSHFVTELSYDEFCNKFYYSKDDSPLIKRLKEVYHQHNKIIFFFDGFDEWESDNFNNFIRLLDEIQADNKCKVWVSTRLNCRHFFAKKIKGCAIEFEDLQESDQRRFIESRLNTQCQSDEKLKEVVNDVFQSLYLSKNNDILGTPLLLHIVTDILITENLDEIPKDFFILTKLYELFFEGKVLHYLAKIYPRSENFVKMVFKNHLHTYEVPALLSCLTAELFHSLNIKEDKNLVDMRQIDPIGIIINTQSDAKNISFKFYHQTYAEYFAAKWLAKNINEIPYDARAFLFEDRYENLKLMFDMLMAEDCKAHIAVLYKNVEMLKECNQSDKREKDKLGRSVLHLLFSNAEKFPLLPLNCTQNDVRKNDKCPSKSDIFIEINEGILFFEPNSNMKNLLACLIDPEICLLDQDKFLGKSAIDYAVSRFSVSSLDHIAKLNKFNSNLVERLQDKICLIILYSLSCGYLNILKLEPVAKYLTQHLNSKFFKYVYSQDKTESYTMTPIFIAAFKGHIDLVKKLLSKNADINLTMDDRASPLFVASYNGHVDIVKVLLSNDADVNLTMNDGRSPLYIASYNGHVDVVKELLGKNADINLTMNDGRSPLYIASYNGHVDVVKELISKNADINLTKNNGASPLFVASQNGHVDIVRKLLSTNADVNFTMNDGSSPLFVAAQNGHVDIVKKLLSKNAYVNLTKNNGVAPLFIASQNGHVDIVKELLIKNADVNLPRNDGVSPLFIASQNGHVDIVKELLSKSADVNLTMNDRASPLHIASCNGHVDIVKELLSKNADVNLTMNDGASPLYVASYNGHVDVVKKLLSKNADVNLTMNDGRSPLYTASYNGHVNVVKELLNKDADVNFTKNDGASPLFVASENGHVDIVKELLSRNTDVNLTMNDGASPLFVASENGHVDIVKELLKRNADINLTMDDGASPLHIANRNGHFDIAKLLKFYIKYL